MSSERRRASRTSRSGGRRARVIAGLGAALLAAGAVVPILAPTPATAAVVTAAATFDGGGLTCDEWRPAVAPPGATSATFTVTGGGGAAGDDQAGALGGLGGKGGIVSGTVAVQGGQRLWAVVGCGGNGWHAGAAKGYAYGGDPGHPASGGGGGASALCLGTAEGQCAGGDVVAIAGGGGGGGKATKQVNDAGTANAGGAGGSVATSGSSGINVGTSRGGDNGVNGSGGEAPIGGGGAGNTGARGLGGNGAYGNRGQGGDGGAAPASGIAPPTALGVVGQGGLPHTINTRGGGGGGGGLAGGGAGGSGMTTAAQGTQRYNGGAGGGAGSSWYRSSVTSPSFAVAGGTAACLPSSTQRTPIQATNAGFGSTGNGGHGCSGFVTVTWTYENTATTPAVATANNTWVLTPTLDQGCGTVRTYAVPTSTTHVSLSATGGGGGGGGGGDGGSGSTAYGGTGAAGATASVGWTPVRSGGALISPNVNYNIGCGGGLGPSVNGGGVQPGGAGGAGFATGGTGGQTVSGDNRRASGGGGGGASAVCLGSAGATCTTGTQLAVAAGGGGGGGSNWGVDGARTSGGGEIRTGVGQQAINGDTGNAGVSLGGYGGGRGRRASGGGGGGGGAGGPDTPTNNDNDNVSTVGSAGSGSASGATRGGHRATGTPVASGAGAGSGPGNGGAGGYHSAGGTRRGGGGGGGGGFRGGSGGGGDEENSGSPSGGGGGTGSSWVNASLAPEAYSFAPGGGVVGVTSDTIRGLGAGGAPGDPDGSGVAGVAGGVRLVLRGTAITLTTTPGGRSDVLGSSIGSISPVAQNTNFTFQDPTSAATCGCTYAAANLPPGLSMSSAGVVTGTPTTVGTYSNVRVTITSSGGVYAATTAAFTWTINPRPATQVVFSTQPGNGTSASPLSAQPVVQLRDSTDAVVTGSTANVTLAIASGTGTLACTGGNTKAAVAGVATFSGCAVTGTGTFTLSATSPGLPVATSIAFQVVPPNQVPIANAQSVNAPKQVATAFQLSGSDGDGNPLTYAVVASPTKGVVSCSTAGACTYTSNPGQNGADSFTFRVNDGQANSANATVSITIVNGAPVANPQTKAVARQVATPIQLTGTDDDGDPVTYAVLALPTKGVVSCNASGACTYTSNPGTAGPDSFTFRVNDGETSSAPATVTINIANQAPVAVAQDQGTAADQSVVLTLTGSDPDGDAITFQPVLGATAHGSVSGGGSSVQYTPDSGFTGIDTFTFRTTDVGGAMSPPATVRIYVGVSALRGTVTSDQGGAPLAGIEVRLVDDHDRLAADPALVATAVTGAGGTYDFASQFPQGAVPHGDYVIRFVDPARNHFSEWYVDAPTRATSTTVAATAAAPVLQRDAALVPGARLRGRVTSSYAPNGPVAGLQVRLYPSTGGSRAVTTAPDGTYELDLVAAGTYALWFRDVSSGTWISEWFDDQPTQAQAAPIVLTVGQQRTIDEQLAPVAPPAVPPTGSIAGTVSSVGGSPIAGIQVRLYRSPYTTSSAATTDANGHYGFANLPNDAYKVWFRDVTSGTWVSEYHADSASLANAVPVTVAGNARTIDAALASTAPAGPVSGTISGTVTGPGGAPIAGIQVRLYPSPYETSMATTTDGDGAYAFPGRPSGSYKLWFRDVRSGTWVSMFNGGATTLAAAEPIAFPGGPLTVDAELTPR